MIRINDMELVWVEGENVKEALERGGSFHLFMVVRMNDRWLRKDDWTRVRVDDGAVIRTVQMIAGG